MSNQQREAIAFWTNVFVKGMVGISGAVLLLLYYSIKDEAQQTRDEFRKSIEKIEVTTKETNSSVNAIQSRIGILEYRVGKLDRDEN